MIVGGVDVVEVSRFGGLEKSKYQLINMKGLACKKRRTYTGLDMGLSTGSWSRADGSCWGGDGEGEMRARPVSSLIMSAIEGSVGGAGGRLGSGRIGRSCGVGNSSDGTLGGASG